MRIIDLSPTDSLTLLTQILGLPESRHLEFKRVSGKMVNKALETICAFANSEGGHLVLGIADPKEFQGEERLSALKKILKRLTSCSGSCPANFGPPLAASACAV